MGSMTRTTRNQGSPDYHGPVSSTLMNDIIELKSLLYLMPEAIREQVAPRLNSMTNALDVVVGLENATVCKGACRG